MTVRLEGFRELEAALAQLPKATGKNVLRRVAKGALDPMAATAAARAPHRSGRLAYSIAVSEQRTRRAKWQTKQGGNKFSGGRWRTSASTGLAMAMGPAGGLGTLNYASFDEFGTIDTPAFAYMRAAWDGGSDRALEYIKDNLWRVIDQAAAKVAKKRAKLGL